MEVRAEVVGAAAGFQIRVAVQKSNTVPAVMRRFTHISGGSN